MRGMFEETQCKPSAPDPKGHTPGVAPPSPAASITAPAWTIVFKQKLHEGPRREPPTSELKPEIPFGEQGSEQQPL